MGEAKPVKRKEKPKRQRWVIPSTVGLLAIGIAVAFITWTDKGISTGDTRKRAPGDHYETMAAGQLPSFAKGSSKVEQAYQYAAAHPEVLQYMPCTCGCRNAGHRHNGDCYVQERHADGRITFTSHAAT